jgi:elongation factor G
VPIKDVRVIGVYAHIDAGKTTTSEAILYYTGRIHRAGSVDDGNTQLDWMAQERERGITITAAAATCTWRDRRINLIDTPGHIDFTAEVVRSIRIIDGAVIVLCGVRGVETQTETVWMHADRQQLPRIIFVNKLDRPEADFEGVIRAVRERLAPDAVVLQLPIVRDGALLGIADLLRSQALVWRDGADHPAMEDIPFDMQTQVAAARALLLDAVCELDDGLLEQRLAGNEPSLASLQRALRQSTISGELVPVLCGSSRQRIGVSPLLDAIVDYLPAPVDVPPVSGTIPGSREAVERPADLSAPVCASAFKIVTDPHVGHLTWVRVFSGRLHTGESVYNPRADVVERVSRIYRLHANRREQISDMAVSDVVALVGVGSAVTGDTLCDPDHPIVLEGFRFPDPVIGVALMPSSADERDRMRSAVKRLCEEDPTLSSRFDAETGEHILSGMGELHLEIVVERLAREFGVRPAVSEPKVSYRETIRRVAQATGTYRQQSGGHGHFARVELRVEPLERGAGVVFVDEASSAELPGQFVRSTELGAREALGKGIIAGYPVTDVRVTLLGGRFHEVDSAKMDFRIAGSMAVRRAVRRARPALLEPIVEADLNVPGESLGAVMADLGRRRGNVHSLTIRGSARGVRAGVPLAEARGYATDLRSLTQGRGAFTLEFRQYDFVPEALADDIIDRRRAEGKVPVR